MANIRAASSLANVLAANVPVDMDPKVWMYDADETPLLAFTQDLKKTKTVDQPKWNHLWDEPMALWTQVNNGAGYADNATSIAVDDGSIFNTYDILMNTTTGEHLRVTAISTNTLTVTRAFGSTAAAAMADNEYLVCLGNANPEGGTSLDPNTKLETEDYNLTQIFKESIAVTATAAASKFYAGDEFKKNIRNALRNLKRKIEYAGLFGERKLDTTSTANPIRTTRGLNAFITTNRYAIGGNLSEDEFNQDILPDAMRYGSSEKVLYCGVNLLKCFQAWGLSKLQTEVSDSMLGFKCKRYQSPFGDILLARHKMLEGPFAGYGFLVDPDNVGRAELPGRGLKLYPNRQANDYDGRKSEFIAEMGWNLTLEKTHAVISGVTGAT